MGTNRTELRGQHWNAIQHVLLWAYSRIPHSCNSHILLEGLVLAGLGGGLEFLEGLVGFLLKVHSREHSLHVLRIAEALLGALSTDYLLELSIGNSQESRQRLFHYRIGQGAVQLDICPLVSIGAKDVLTEKSSCYGAEALLLISICGFKFSGTCKLVYILIGEGKNGEALIVSLYLHAGALEVCKEFLMGKRLSRDCGDLACSYGAPEIAVGLASYEFGIMEEVKSIVPC